MKRHAYTLIELLVVVMIVLILIAATLPIAKRVMDNNRPREAARQVHAHFAMARAYAARNNRPMGLWLEYDAPIGASDPNLRQCTRIYLAEVQAQYGGGTTTSKATFRNESGQACFVPLVGVRYIDANRDGIWDDDTNGDGVPDPSDQNPADGRVDEDISEKALLLSLIDDGDKFLVKLDRKGPYFECRRVGAQLRYLGTNTSGTTLAPHRFDLRDFDGYSFQVLRAPRRVGSPLELGNGVCIDTEYSGMGPTGLQFGVPNNRLIVLFSPGGAVDGLYLDSVEATPAGTLHFLVGRVDKVNTLPAAGSPYDSATSNLADANSIWVSVGRLNGSITTSENLPDAEHATSHPNPWTVAGRAEYLEECRSAATGRELAGGQ